MKKPINHQRNMNIGILIALAFALIVSAVNPINGWVAGLITIVVVVLPMTLIKAIISVAQSRERPNNSNVEVSTTSNSADAAPEVAESSTTGTSVEQFAGHPLGYKDHRIRGWVHLSLGVIILTFAILQIQQAQHDPLWTKMFTEPFWWIIAFCSSVSFILSISNFNKAALRKEEVEK